MTTVGVVLSEKVDTTFSKGVLRIFGTVCGGVLGAPRASRRQTRTEQNTPGSASFVACWR